MNTVAMRRAIVIFGVAALTACSATPFTVAWNYSEDDPQFELLERCIADELAAARTKGVVEVNEVVSRRQAKAMRRLLEIVDAGDTPTEREYRLAGC